MRNDINNDKNNNITIPFLINKAFKAYKDMSKNRIGDGWSLRSGDPDSLLNLKEQLKNETDKEVMYKLIKNAIKQDSGRKKYCSVLEAILIPLSLANGQVSDEEHGRKITKAIDVADKKLKEISKIEQESLSSSLYSWFSKDDSGFYKDFEDLLKDIIRYLTNKKNEFKKYQENLKLKENELKNHTKLIKQQENELKEIQKKSSSNQEKIKTLETDISELEKNIKEADLQLKKNIENQLKLSEEEEQKKSEAKENVLNIVEPKAEFLHQEKKLINLLKQGIDLLAYDYNLENAGNKEKLSKFVKKLAEILDTPNKKEIISFFIKTITKILNTPNREKEVLLLTNQLLENLYSENKEETISLLISCAEEILDYKNKENGKKITTLDELKSMTPNPKISDRLIEYAQADLILDNLHDQVENTRNLWKADSTEEPDACQRFLLWTKQCLPRFRLVYYLIFNPLFSPKKTKTILENNFNEDFFELSKEFSLKAIELITKKKERLQESKRKYKAIKKKNENDNELNLEKLKKIDESYNQLREFKKFEKELLKKLGNKFSYFLLHKKGEPNSKTLKEGFYLYRDNKKRLFLLAVNVVNAKKNRKTLHLSLSKKDEKLQRLLSNWPKNKKEERFEVNTYITLAIIEETKQREKHLYELKEKHEEKDKKNKEEIKTSEEELSKLENEDRNFSSLGGIAEDILKRVCNLQNVLLQYWVGKNQTFTPNLKEKGYYLYKDKDNIFVCIVDYNKNKEILSLSKLTEGNEALKNVLKNLLSNWPKETKMTTFDSSIIFLIENNRKTTSTVSPVVDLIDKMSSLAKRNYLLFKNLANEKIDKKKQARQKQTSSTSNANESEPISKTLTIT